MQEKGDNKNYGNYAKKRMGDRKRSFP